MAVDGGAIRSVDDLTIIPVEVDPPPVDVLVGGPVDGTRTVDGGNTVVFDLDLGEPPTPDAAAVLYRHDTTGWYPVDAAADGHIQHARTELSWFAWGWIETLADGITNIVNAMFGLRSDPLTCDGPPDWADFTPGVVDVVHSCATTNTADGVERVEVQLRNNRGVFVEVTVPDGVAYAFVEGQPDPVRAIVRTFTGRDSMLLEPGQFASMGFTQPSPQRVVPIRVDLSAASLLATTLIKSVEEVLVDSDRWLAVPALLSSCDLGPRMTDLTPELDGFGDLVARAARCIPELLTDPGRVAQIAAETVAAINGVDVSLVHSDRAFARQLDRMRGLLRVVRSLAVVCV